MRRSPQGSPDGTMACRRRQGAFTHRGNVKSIKGHLEDQNQPFGGRKDSG